MAQNEAAPEPSIAEAADELAQALDGEAADPVATEPIAAVPERIGGNTRSGGSQARQKRVRDGGLEKFVEEQVAREALSGPAAAVHSIDRTAAGAKYRATRAG